MEGAVYIKGVQTYKGMNPVTTRKDSSVVLEFQMGVSGPRDSATGLSLGKRLWQPIMWRQPVDAAVVQYQQALTQNEVLTSVKFDFFRPQSNQLASGAKGSVGGEKTAFYTIELTNAQFQSVRFIQQYTRSEHPEIKNSEIMAEVLVTFMKITQTWADGGISMSDDWTSPQG